MVCGTVSIVKETEESGFTPFACRLQVDRIKCRSRQGPAKLHACICRKRRPHLGIGDITNHLLKDWEPIGGTLR